MKKLTLILISTILSSATFAEFATDPCDLYYCGEEAFDPDSLNNKWKQETQIDDLYKGIPQRFRY